MDIHTLSRFNRFKDIVLILIKYGFGDIIARLDLPERLFPFYTKSSYASHKNPWERIRLVLEELGPTFIKLGQMLSLRTDLIPTPLAKELSKLEDEVPPEDFANIQAHIEKSYDKALHDIFSDFEPEPIAAASLAQVHKAILRADKTVVAVKIQRPGIRQTIKNDLHIMAGLARQIHERIESLQIYDFPRLVKEFNKSLMHELDFEREARNIRLAQANFFADPNLYIPKVFSEITTSRVLVMELIQGSKLRKAVELPSEVKKKLAVNGIRTSLKQILEDGFFHADPHPGNIIVLDNARFSLLDWGMVGRITPHTRFKLLTLIEGIVDKDSEIVLDVLLSLSQKPSYQEYEQVIDKESLQRELLDLLDDYHSLPLKDINLGHLLSEIIDIMRNYNILIRSDLAMMIKALVTSEGTARLLFPDLDIVAEAEPYVKKIARKRYAPNMIRRQIQRNLGNYLQLQKDMPLQLNHILGKMERGEFSIGFEHKRLEGLRQTLERITNRLTLGIITASMIIGSSMIITTGIRPFIFGYPALGLVGYLLSACVGGWLAIDIIRKT